MARGFSLVEVLVATVVMTVAAVSLAQVSLQGVRANRHARSVTLATLLASRKMTQLRALAWSFDESGMPVSDLSTNTTMAAELPSGGSGLSATPSGSLLGNTAGSVDFIDATGSVLPPGTTPPAATEFVRRWSVTPVPGVLVDTLVLQVVVAPVWAHEPAGPVGSSPTEGIRLVLVKARKGS